MTITRNHNGSFTVSAMRGEYLVSRTYYGYTKREALAIFKQEQCGDHHKAIAELLYQGRPRLHGA